MRGLNAWAWVRTTSSSRLSGEGREALQRAPCQLMAMPGSNCALPATFQSQAAKPSQSARSTRMR